MVGNTICDSTQQRLPVEEGRVLMFRAWLKNIIYAGYVEEASAEVRKQIIISSLFSLTSFVLLIGYGIESITSGELQ